MDARVRQSPRRDRKLVNCFWPPATLPYLHEPLLESSLRRPSPFRSPLGKGQRGVARMRAGRAGASGCEREHHGIGRVRRGGHWKQWDELSGFPVMGDATYGLPVVVFDKRGGTSAGSTTIYVAAEAKSAGSNLYATSNGGTSWALVAGGPTGLMVHHAAVGTEAPCGSPTEAITGRTTRAAARSRGRSGSTPRARGRTSRRPRRTGARWPGGISVDAANPQHVVVSTLDWYGPDRVLATKDGGATWCRCFSAVGQGGIDFAESNPNVVVRVGNSGAIGDRRRRVERQRTDLEARGVGAARLHEL